MSVKNVLLGVVLIPVALVAVGVGLVAIGSTQDSSTANFPAPPAPQPVEASAPNVDTTAWMIPHGYSLTPGDPTVAYRWDNDPQCAEYDNGCWGVYVVSRDGCSNDVYVEANIISGGTVIGYTNATLGSLGPNEPARLTLSDMTDAQDDEARLTKIACL